MNTASNSNKQSDKKKLRKFGFITGCMVATIFGIILPWLFKHEFPYWPWIVCALLSTWALLLPTSLSHIYQGWMAIGHVLGWINTRVILGIIFYVIFLPFGLVMKMVGKDSMSRKLDKSLSSYRVFSKRQTTEHFEKPY